MLFKVTMYESYMVTLKLGQQSSCVGSYALRDTENITHTRYTKMCQLLVVLSLTWFISEKLVVNCFWRYQKYLYVGDQWYNIVIRDKLNRWHDSVGSCPSYLSQVTSESHFSEVSCSWNIFFLSISVNLNLKLIWYFFQILNVSYNDHACSLVNFSTGCLW